MMIENEKEKFQEFKKSNSKYVSQYSSSYKPIKPLMTFEEFAQKQEIFKPDMLDWVKNEFYKLPRENDYPGYIYIYYSN